MPETLSPRALCTVAQVQDQFSLDDDDTSGDDSDSLIRLINSVSETIHVVTGREIISLDTTPAPRLFDISHRSWTRRNGWEIPIGDLSSVDGDTVIELVSPTGASQGAITDAVALPRVRTESWRPYTKVRLPYRYRFALQGACYPGYVLRVTGTWGFPEVPSFVTDACMVGVALKGAKDVYRFSETFASDGATLVLPGQLPKRVLSMLSPIMPVPVPK